MGRIHCGDSFDARVLRIAPQVDPTRGTVETRLEVPNPPSYLKAEMTVSVEVETARIADALVIPREAVRDTQGSHWVLIDDDGIAVKRSIKKGIEGHGRLQVVDGVTAGEDVIITTSVRPGERVRVQTSSGG